jgi:ABC-type nitrate/sulfonate/bicarbonate transport system substrate-binding protein
VVAFLRAHIKATKYIYDAKNRDEVIAILAKTTRTDRKVAADTYDLYMRQQVIAREAGLFEEGIKSNFDALVALGDISAAPPLAGFIDASFLAEASK